ncbi:MAG TPA: hypothetical protein VGP02_07285 [Mycobacteriales bacterium]|nr:hypothetical protein [Mycobacteriales bacterium]
MRWWTPSTIRSSPASTTTDTPTATASARRRREGHTTAPMISTASAALIAWPDGKL